MADAVIRKQFQWLVAVMLLADISTVITAVLGGAGNANDRG